MFRRFCSSLLAHHILLLWLAGQSAGLCLGVQRPGEETFRDTLHRAQILWDQGQHDLAIKDLQEFLDSDLGDSASAEYRAAAYRELGRFHLARGNREGAVAAFTSSLGLDGSQGITHYQLGMLYLGTGKLKEGTSELEQAIFNGFRNLGVLSNLVQAYLAVGRTTDALDRFEEIMSLKPTSKDVPFRLGQVLFQHLYYQQARKAFRLSLDNAPDFYDARFFLALTDYLLEQFEVTTELLSPLVSKSQTVEVLNLLGCAYGKLGRFDEAIQTLKEAIHLDPRRRDSHINLALVYLDMERVKDAEELLQAARSLPSNGNTKVFYNLSRNSCAQVEREIKNHDAQVQDTERAAYYYDLALQFQARYYHSTAVEFLRLARKSGKDTPELFLAAGLSCLNLESLSSSAPSILTKAIELKSDFAEAHYLLGRAYSRQEKAHEALKAYRKAVELRSDSAAYHYELGKILAAPVFGNAELEVSDAIKAFEEAIRLDPEHAPSHCELGKIYMRLTRYNQAVSYLEKSVQLQPEFYEPYYPLGRLYARMNQPEKAKAFFETFDKKRQASTQRATVKGGFITSTQ